jgi:hypothetical protein
MGYRGCGFDFSSLVVNADDDEMLLLQKYWCQPGNPNGQILDGTADLALSRHHTWSNGERGSTLIPVSMIRNSAQAITV